MESSAPSPESAQAASQGAGLLASLRQLLANLIGVARARGELLQVELEEEKLRVAGIVVYAVAAAVFLEIGRAHV